MVNYKTPAAAAALKAFQDETAARIETRKERLAAIPQERTAIEKEIARGDTDLPKMRADIAALDREGEALRGEIDSIRSFAQERIDDLATAVLDVVREDFAAIKAEREPFIAAAREAWQGWIAAVAAVRGVEEKSKNIFSAQLAALDASKAEKRFFSLPAWDEKEVTK
jgi:chromosome segregation ATPase